MKLVKEFNLLEDKKILTILNIASIPLILIFAVLFILLSSLTHDLGKIDTDFSGLELLLGVGILFILVVIHELIHGLFFKVFNPNGKVAFGFKNGMAYATSPNSFYSKWKFIIILLSPFVFITVALYILMLLGVINAIVFTIFASLHASCCVGDFYMTFLVAKQAKGVLVEDTDVGINLYVKDE